MIHAFLGLCLGFANWKEVEQGLIKAKLTDFIVLLAKSSGVS